MGTRHFRVIQYLSIDIVIGAVVLLRFFSFRAGVTINWSIYFLLASAVWLIYTLDHLMDAVKAHETTRPRYLFHKRYRKQIIYGALTLSLASFVVLFYIPINLLIGGSLLAFLCLVYAVSNHRLAQLGVKEFYVSFIYVSGIFLTPTIFTGQLDVHSFILLLILAFLNLLIFSWMESKEDELEGFVSLATRWGALKLEKLILTLISFGIALAATSLVKDAFVAGYFVAAFLLYMLLILRPSWAKANNRYRMIGDGVFVLPILFELF